MGKKLFIPLSIVIFNERTLGMLTLHVYLRAFLLIVTRILEFKIIQIISFLLLLSTHLL